MWTDELIFSEGDLCNPENYLAELRSREKYTLNLRERQLHLIQLIKRITAEMKLIEKLIDDCFIITNSEIEAIIAFDIEDSFNYITNHWEDYCKWCLDHDPDSFPVGDIMLVQYLDRSKKCPDRPYLTEEDFFTDEEISENRLFELERSKKNPEDYEISEYPDLW